MGQKHEKFREFWTPFPPARHPQKSAQHGRACAAGDGAICSKNRIIVPYHGDNPNTRNGARLRSPSPIMAPDGTEIPGMNFPKIWVYLSGYTSRGFPLFRKPRKMMVLSSNAREIFGNSIQNLMEWKAPNGPKLVLQFFKDLQRFYEFSWRPPVYRKRSINYSHNSTL